MAKSKVNKIEEAQILLDKLLVEYVITKNEMLTTQIKELEAKIDYFNYGIKPRKT
jgi:hypothetical protein